MNLLIVFLGGGFGAVCRYLFGVGVVRLSSPANGPLATFMINVIGSFLMGLLIGAISRIQGGVDDRWRLALGVGVLGGFTTFSSFSLEAVMMIERRAYALAAAYIVGSVVFGLLGLMLGLLIMRRLPA
jgi:CrcB protein